MNSDISLTDVIINACLASLQSQGIPCFLGGSRRFGYHTDASDVDIVMLCSGCESIEDVRVKLSTTVFNSAELFAVSENHLSGEVYDSNDVLGYLAKYNIHLSIFMSNIEAFKRLEKEHELIANMLSNNAELMYFVKQMVALKSTPRNADSILTGLHIFRALRATCIHMVTKLS